MKRGREDGKLETEDIANCLMLLSKVGETTDVNRNSSTPAFVCKTCNRQFTSFQALGGHRASHKKPRLMAGDLFHRVPTSPSKPKTHECPVCGLEFPLGQALGGHMRRHRAGAVMSEGLVIKHAALQPVMKKSSSKRVLFLDLNLTPLQGDDLKLCSW